MSFYITEIPDRIVLEKINIDELMTWYWIRSYDNTNELIQITNKIHTNFKSVMPFCGENAYLIKKFLAFHRNISNV